MALLKAQNRVFEPTSYSKDALVVHEWGKPSECAVSGQHSACAECCNLGRVCESLYYSRPVAEHRLDFVRSHHSVCLSLCQPPAPPADAPG